ncbi:GNAT family N-acetyltransferase [Gracilibacillus oryzae]|uniref:GNAT family N-acetyltransferase n=1 Tax=Gracilibacillus oryzae TaxID=1672701 RepID=A0A7C8KMT1_9BACI|nr:GNAT family N-acetyltransferase [Gracilibacillus oryzae]KAB8126589.1 GNAT family N-acetyltransferase [Gracilibacillus oryzae]
MELTKEKVVIREIRKDDVPEAIKFVLKIFHEVFPFELGEASRTQLFNMEEIYINKDDAFFAGAFTEGGTLVGTIAVQRYDNRIETIKDRFDLEETAEITKCYLDSAYRRMGIGSLLFEEALRFCENNDRYKTLYLHTHKFLPGGFPFWKKKGFSIVLDEQDEMEMVHMEREL